MRAQPTSPRSSLRSTVRRGAIVLATSVGLVSAAQPAMAVYWKSASSPLTAYHESASSGQKQAQAYGNYYNSGATHARNTSSQRDSKPGGDSVYVETKFQFYYGVSGQAPAWQTTSSKQTTRTTSGSWKSDYTRTALHGSAERSRGRIHVCEDQSWAPDDCSAWAYATFTY